MSHFTSKEIIKIDLGEGESISIRKEIPYTDLETIVAGAAKAKGDESEALKLNLPLLKLAVVGWDLKDDAGVPVPFSVETLAELNVETIQTVLAKVAETYFPKKKASTESTTS
jgi:hypothetical protein